MNKKKKFKPLSDTVIIKQSEESDERYGALYVSNLGKEKTLRGTVIAVGPGKRYPNGDFDPMKLSVGDEVLFAPFSAQLCVLNREEYVICREIDIYTGVEEEDEEEN